MNAPKNMQAFCVDLKGCFVCWGDFFKKCKLPKLNIVIDLLLSQSIINFLIFIDQKLWKVFIEPSKYLFVLESELVFKDPEDWIFWWNTFGGKIKGNNQSTYI